MEFLKKYRILIAVICTIALLGGGLVAAHLWNRRFQKRCERLLAEALDAEQRNDWTQLESTLRRYTRLRGEDSETCVRIGRAIEKGATTQEDRLRALPFYAKATSLSPKNLEPRLRLAELRIQESPLEAIRYIDAVLLAAPDDPEAWRIKAMALCAGFTANETDQQRVRKTYDIVTKVLSEQPGDLKLVEFAVTFIGRFSPVLSRVLGQPKAYFQEACRTALDRSVTAAEDEAEARLQRILLSRRFKLDGTRLTTAKEDLRRLVQLRPQSNVIRLLATGVSLLEGTSVDAKRPGLPSNDAAVSEATMHLQAAIGSTPEDPTPYWTLAQIQWWSQEHEKAIETLRAGVESVDAQDFQTLVLNLRMVECQMAMHDWSEAAKTLETLETSVRQTSESDQTNASDEGQNARRKEIHQYVDSMVRLLWAQWHLGVDNPERDLARPLPLLESLQASRRPEIAGLAQYLRGMTYATQNRWDLAANTFMEAAKRIDGTVLPRLAAAHALHRLGRFREAIVQYKHALLTMESRPEQVNIAQIWIELASCELAKQSLQPTWKRDWRQFDETLRMVDSRLPGSQISFFLTREAQRLGKRAKDGEAAQALERAKQRWEKSPEFWASLAVDQMRNASHEGALEAIYRWETLTGDTALVLRAELASLTGDVKAAEEYWSEIDSEETHKRWAHFDRRIGAAIRSNRTVIAERLIEERRGEFPNDVHALFQLAQVAWASGDVKELVATSRELEQLAGSEARETRIARIQALFLAVAQGAGPEQKDELTRSCREFSRSHPGDRQAFGLEALCMELLGDRRAAIKAWRRAIALGEQDPQVLLRYSALLKREGMARDALEVSLAAAAAPFELEAATLAAEIMPSVSADPQTKKCAEALFQKVLSKSQDQKMPEFLLNLAVLREYQNEPGDAVRLTQQALRTRPRAIELRNNLAWFMAAYHGQAQEALKVVDDVIEEVGPLPALLDTRAVALLAANRTDEAIETLEKIVTGTDVPAARLLHLSEAYWAANRLDDAKSFLKQVEVTGIGGLVPRDRQAFLRLKAKL